MPNWLTGQYTYIYIYIYIYKDVHMYVYIECVILTHMLLNNPKSRAQCEFYWYEVVFGMWIIIDTFNDIFNELYSMLKYTLL